MLYSSSKAEVLNSAYAEQINKSRDHGKFMTQRVLISIALTPTKATNTQDYKQQELTNDS